MPTSVASPAQQVPIHATMTPERLSHAAASRCPPAQLIARFQAGGLGAGNDFGNIEIRNVGPARCRIAGRVRFAAYFASGLRDVNAVTRRRTVVSAVLPVESQWRQRPRRSGLLDVIISGEYRDDPNQPDGLCRPVDEGHPLNLVVRIGERGFTVTNYSPRRRDPAYNLTWVEGCHGDLALAGLVRPYVDGD